MQRSLPEHVEAFVLELVRTGWMLDGVLADLVDALPVDAYPGEEPSAVVFEMLCGTIATALASVDPPEVRRATELIDLSGARVVEHLRLACALSRCIHRGDGRIGGSDG